MVSLSLNFRVRQGLNNGARISAREGHEALLTCSSKEAPSRILFRGLSVCRSSSRKPNRPRCFVQDASKRSNGLSRKRVPSSGEYSCPSVPTLPNSNHRKRPNDTTGNSCIRITGKKINTAAPHPFVESI